MDDRTIVLPHAKALLDAATPSTRRLAEQILADGMVELSRTSDTISARVTGPRGSSRRTVTFSEAEGELSWRCTCKSEASPLCKHVVATLLAAQTDADSPPHDR